MKTSPRTRLPARLTAAVLLPAAMLVGCTQEKAPPRAMHPKEAELKARVDASRAGPLAEAAPASPPASGPFAALPPGTFVEYEVEGVYLKPALATFTVLEDRGSQRRVEVALRPRGSDPLPGTLQRPLVFVMARTHLLPPFPPLPRQRVVATDQYPNKDPNYSYARFETSADSVEVGGHAFECIRFDLRRGGWEARGCVHGTDARVALAGGALMLEETWGGPGSPNVKARLVAHGKREPRSSEPVLALKASQAAAYGLGAGKTEQHTWSTSLTRVRHVSPGGIESVIAPDWEGTLLDMVFELAALDSFRADLPRYARPLGAEEDLPVGDRSVRVLRYTRSGLGPSDCPYQEEAAIAANPWALEDAPLWVRFLPMARTYTSCPSFQYQLTGWR